jgi:hypothetical protein
VIPLIAEEGNPNVVLPTLKLNLVRIVSLCRTETHKELTTHKRAQVIVTSHASKHKTITKEEHMINEILKLLIEES